MIKRKIEDLKEGDIIATYIYDENRVAVLVPGVVITKEVIDILKKLKIDEVIVDYTIEDDLQRNFDFFTKKIEIYSKHYINHKKCIKEIVKNIIKEDYFKRFSIYSDNYKGVVYSRVIRDEIKNIWNIYLENRDGDLLLYPLLLLRKYDESLYWRSISISIISVITGYRLKLDLTQLSFLLIASLLFFSGRLILSIEDLDDYWNDFFPMAIGDYSYYLISKIPFSPIIIGRIVKYGSKKFINIPQKDTITLSSSIIKVVFFYEKNVNYSNNDDFYINLRDVLRDLYLNPDEFNIDVVKALRFKLNIYPEGIWVKVEDRGRFSNYKGVVVRDNIERKDKIPVIHLLYDEQGRRLPKPIEINLTFYNIKIEPIPPIEEYYF